jgi:hypothetical protein
VVQAELIEVRDRIQRAKDTATALSEQSLRLISQAAIVREECSSTRRSDRPVGGRRAPARPTMTVDVPASVPGVGVGGTGAAPIQGLSDPRLQLRSFCVEGRIGDHVVVARYEAGVLDCDPVLRTHAELVVAVGDSFPFGNVNHALPASLDGPPVVVLLTLMRASFVTKVQAAV